jgi:hypothetical protein
VSSNNDTELVRAVVTALAKFEISKRHAYTTAKYADEIESTHESRWDRSQTHAELMAAIEARGDIGVALIESGVSLDSIREIEATVFDSSVLA